MCEVHKDPRELAFKGIRSSLEKLTKSSQIVDIGDLDENLANEIFNYYQQDYNVLKGQDNNNEGKYFVTLSLKNYQGVQNA